jgi:hypothetical protein
MALIAVAGDVADRQRIVAGAIEKDHAGVARVLIALEIRRVRGLVEEGERGPRAS